MWLVATLTGVTSIMFAIEGFVLNGYALYFTRNFDKDISNGNAQIIFLTTLWYSFFWMVLILLYSKNWNENIGSNEFMKIDDDVVFYLKKQASESGVRERSSVCKMLPMIILGHVQLC